MEILKGMPLLILNGISFGMDQGMLKDSPLVSLMHPPSGIPLGTLKGIPLGNGYCNYRDKPGGGKTLGGGPTFDWECEIGAAESQKQNPRNSLGGVRSPWGGSRSGLLRGIRS